MSSFFSNKWLLAAIIAAGQSGVLYYMIESRASILRSGHEVVLRTEPIDPRDMMRGDYVILSYPLSRLDPAVIQGTAPEIGPAEVWISLIKDGVDPDLWTFSRASWQKFNDAKPDEIVLVGKTPDYYGETVNPVPLTFGIERFYVPEGEGRPIEEGVREKSVHVVLAVNDKGRAQIKSLRMDGQILYDEPMY